MISLNYSDIPKHFHAGDFYRSLCSDDESCAIEIPSECFYPSDRLDSNAYSMETLQDFTNLLKSTAFWGLDKIPTGLIHFCASHIFLLWRRVVDDGFSDVLFARNLRTIFCTLSGSEEPLIKSIEMGSTQIVEFLVKRANSSAKAAACAAEYGRKDYLQLLRDHGHTWDETACTAAAKAGHLKCLQYLFENGCSWDGKVFVAACKNGHRDCMEYALENGIQWSFEAVLFIAQHGNLESLEFAVNHSCVFTAPLTMISAAAGNLVCLQYFLENGFPVDHKSWAAASHSGRLDVLQLLRAYNIPWNADSTERAAQYGRIDCLQYLHTNGCPWDSRTTRMAIFNGHAQCLQYALENGCPYEECILQDSVVSGKRMQCLRYLVEEENLYLNEDGSVFLKAFVVANSDAMQYLLDQGCPYQNCSIDESDLFWFAKCCEEDRFDCKLLKSIKIVHLYRWDMLRRNSELTNCIKAKKYFMPLCWRYLIEEVFAFYD